MANQEHLDILRQGVDAWNEWRKEFLDPLIKADLQLGPDLSGADLEFLDLSGANLYKANLTGANLYSTRLREANLQDAKLIKANLYGADLTGRTPLSGDQT